MTDVSAVHKCVAFVQTASAEIPAGGKIHVLAISGALASLVTGNCMCNRHVKTDRLRGRCRVACVSIWNVVELRILTPIKS